MVQATLDPLSLAAFKTAERDGWGEKAGVYDDFTGQITVAAIDPLLAAVDLRPGMRLLDVACGPGYLTDAARRSGAETVGIDFAHGMVTEAARRYPDCDFRVGDAEAIDFAPESFDAVTCGFAVLHMADPDAALAEAFRVLAPGGRYAFTVWLSPDQHEFFSLVIDTIRDIGTLDVPLPPAPPMFRFSDPAECRRSLAAAGFAEVTVSELPIVWRIASPADVLGYVQKCMMRLAMVLDRQGPGIREKIHDAILDRAERFRRADGYEVGWPALLASGRKP